MLEYFYLKMASKTPFSISDILYRVSLKTYFGKTA
jgi:hypothetical protein